MFLHRHTSIIIQLICNYIADNKTTDDEVVIPAEMRIYTTIATRKPYKLFKTMEWEVPMAASLMDIPVSGSQFTGVKVNTSSTLS